MAQNQKKQLPWKLSCLYAESEVIAQRGEDAGLACVDRPCSLLGVFDGCGGLGSKQYAAYSNHTAAYFASRASAAVMELWFTRASGREPEAGTRSVQQLKKDLDYGLGILKKKLDSDSPALIGSLIRSFPTTLAACVFQQVSKSLQCLFIWAGDSRGYLLTTEGLCQITRDDLRFDGDAFDNLYADSSLSNLVSGDGRYVLHTAGRELPLPAVVITATDGAFSYLPSPMHFEQLLLETMAQAYNETEWQQLLTERIREIAGDDSTLLMQPCGWSSYAIMKMQFSKRRQKLRKALELCENQEQLKGLWQQEKRRYESMLAEKAGAEDGKN